MKREVAGFVVAVISCAAAVTLTAAQVFGLARLGRWRAAVLGLLFPPLGAALAYRAGLRRRAVAFAIALGAYGVARMLGD